MGVKRGEGEKKRNPTGDATGDKLNPSDSVKKDGNRAPWDVGDGAAAAEPV